MKCLGAEVEFKSVPAAYWIEKGGVKNHTERMINAKEREWLKKHKVERIRISNTGDASLYFTRKITNIYIEGDILGYTLYSFTWKHETGEVQK